MKSRVRIAISCAAAMLILSLLPAMSPRIVAQTTYSDDMSNPATGLFSQQSDDPTQYSYQYLNGQFVIQALSPTFIGDVQSRSGTPEIANSSMTVDAGIGSADEQTTYVFAGCRAGADNNGYLFLLVPGTGQASIWREDAAGSVKLGEANALAAVTPGSNQFNRIGIDCLDSTISGSVNGTVVVTQTDSTYLTGRNYMGIGNSGPGGSLFGVFDNVVITDLGASTASTGTAGTTTTTVPTPASGAAGSGSAGTTNTSTTGQLTFQQGIDWVRSNPPLIDPISASADMVDGDRKFLSADVSVMSFYAEVSLVMPTNAPAGIWAAGFCFWIDAEGNCYSASFSANDTGAQWVVFYKPSAGDLQMIAFGQFRAGNLAPGSTNVFGLLVSGSTGYVTLNSDIPAGVFTVPSQPVAGNVEINISFSADLDGDTRPLHLEMSNFTVWDLAGATGGTAGTGTSGTSGTSVAPTRGTGAQTGTATQPAGATTGGLRAPVSRIAGPLSGSLEENLDTVKIANAGVSLADFYATATFIVPADVTVPWDITIGFRENPTSSNEYRFTVFSDGDWRLTYGLDQPALASGTLTNLATTPGQMNTLEITADGITGVARLNGIEIATLDLSFAQDAADIWIATATVGSTTQPGRQTPYSAFEVWSLS